MIGKMRGIHLKQRRLLRDSTVVPVRQRDQFGGGDGVCKPLNWQSFSH